MSRTVVLFSSILTSVLLPTRAAAFPSINLISYISYSILFCQEDIKAAQVARGRVGSLVGGGSGEPWESNGTTRARERQEQTNYDRGRRRPAPNPALRAGHSSVEHTSTMTLHIVEIRGRSMWWTWVIRDDTGVLVEESRTQFRSAAAAESQGRARIADLEHR